MNARHTIAGSWPIFRFGLVTVALFVVASLPWPGLRSGYARTLRRAGEIALAPISGGARVMLLQPRTPTPSRSFDTAVQVVDSATGAGREMEIDLRGIGWIPTALVAALVLATPVTRAARLRALLPTVFAVQLMTLLSIGVAAATLGDDATVPWQRHFLQTLEYTLVEQMGVSFVFPTFVWLAWLSVSRDGLAAICARMLPMPVTNAAASAPTAEERNEPTNAIPGKIRNRVRPPARYRRTTSI